jgi:hypothetical protein
MEASASTLVPLSSLSVPLGNVGLLATVCPMRAGNTSKGDSDSTRRIDGCEQSGRGARARWVEVRASFPTKIEPVVR